MHVSRTFEYNMTNANLLPRPLSAPSNIKLQSTTRKNELSLI